MRSKASLLPSRKNISVWNRAQGNVAEATVSGAPFVSEAIKRACLFVFGATSPGVCVAYSLVGGAGNRRRDIAGMRCRAMQGHKRKRGRFVNASTNECKVTPASHNRAELTRRGLIGGAAAIAAGTALTGLAAADEPAKEAIAPAIGHINHVSLICSGCHTCEILCTLGHDGVINPYLSRNTVHTDIQAGDVTHVLYCQQCDDPKCLKACPTGALHVDPDTGARVIDQDVCVGCQSCLSACIFAQGGQGESRIKYNPETGKCFKCDLCGGEPKCVKYCPLGASMSSWIEYGPIVRPQIDDYVVATTEGAIEGVEFTKEVSGPQAAKCADTRDWALVATDTGAAAVGEFTSSEGGELRVTIHAEFYDASDDLLGISIEHQYCLTMHEYLSIDLPCEGLDPMSVASVKLLNNVTYWVAGVDEEY